MDEIKDTDKDIGVENLIFVVSNREKFNFKICSKVLNFLSAIYNGTFTL